MVVYHLSKHTKRALKSEMRTFQEHIDEKLSIFCAKNVHKIYKPVP